MATTTTTTTTTTMATAKSRKSRSAERGRESFGKVISKSIQRGIISKSSAAPRIKKGHHKAKEKLEALGLSLDQRYMTLYNTKKGPKLLVRITTKDGFQQVALEAHEFDDGKQMFAAADKMRRHILRSGKAPTTKKREKIISSVIAESKIHLTPMQQAASAPSEQVSKSIDTPSIQTQDSKKLLVEATLAVRAATEALLLALK